MSYTPAKPKKLIIDWTLQQLDLKAHLPESLLRLGTFIICASIAMLFFIAWLLEYNDTIQANIAITTRTLPKQLVAVSSGELLLLVKDNQSVHKDQPLALIKNTANFQDIQQLKAILRTTDPSLVKAQLLSTALDNWNIGILQLDLVSLAKHYKQYKIYQNTKENEALIQSKQEQIDFYKERIQLFQKKAALIEKDIRLSDKQLAVDQRLYEESILSERSLDQATQSQLVKSYNSLDNTTLINDLHIQIKKLEQDILLINSQFKSDTKQLQQNIVNSLELLESKLQVWEKAYLIKASINGICTFTDYLNDYQYINKGEQIFTILPNNTMDYFGLLKLPIKGSGKVKIGQVVNVQLAQYPANEFGIIKGRIESISSIPQEGLLNVKVHFINGLCTTYNVNFEFQHLLSGQAEIITNRMSFLDRILNQIKGRQLNQ